MMRICMYHDVWKCNVLAGENKSRITCGRIELNSSFPLGMTNEDDCKDKSVRRKELRWGINRMKRLLRGEILCGEEILCGDFNDELRWGRYTLLRILTINSVGDSVDKLCWGF